MQRSAWCDDGGADPRTRLQAKGRLGSVTATKSRGSPHGSVGKEAVCRAGDVDLIPGIGRSPGEGNDNPLQSSCLENLMHRGTRWATVHGITRSTHKLATKPPPPPLKAKSHGMVSLSKSPRRSNLDHTLILHF